MKKQLAAVLTALLTQLIFWGIALGQQASGPRKPGAEEKRLGYFVGKWTEEVDVKPSALGPGHKGVIKETCEWFDGDFQVVCRGNYSGTEGPVKSLSYFAYDREEKVYVYSEIISDGDSDSFKGKTVDGSVWTWESETKINGKVIKSRYTYKEVSADLATSRSELQGDDGKWNLVMEGTDRRVQ